MPVMRTDGRLVGRSVGRSRDYQIFWDGQIYLPMVLRRRASRAELRYYHIFKGSISIIIIIIIIIKVNYNYHKKSPRILRGNFYTQKAVRPQQDKICHKISAHVTSKVMTSSVSFDYFRIKFFFVACVADTLNLFCIERLRINAQYRVLIPQSRQDICRRLLIGQILMQFVISSI